MSSVAWSSLKGKKITMSTGLSQLVPGDLFAFLSTQCKHDRSVALRHIQYLYLLHHPMGI